MRTDATMTVLILLATGTMGCREQKCRRRWAAVVSGVSEKVAKAEEAANASRPLEERGKAIDDAEAALKQAPKLLDEIGDDQECLGVTGQVKAEKELDIRIENGVAVGIPIRLAKIETPYHEDVERIEASKIARTDEEIEKGKAEIAALKKNSLTQKCDSAIDDFVEKKSEKFNLDRRLKGLRYDQDPALWNDSIALATSLGSLTHDIDELKKRGACSTEKVAYMKQKVEEIRSGARTGKSTVH